MAGIDYGLKGKKVVITGAARGIGRQLALGFAAQRAEVLVHYGTSQAQAASVAEQIRTAGGKATIFSADLRQPAQITALVQEAHARLGLIDIWINNAGASVNSSETQGMSEVEMFENIVGVDVLGTWRCSREVKAYMQEGGSILTTGWDRALDGAPGLPNQLYAISKGAIMSLTRSLAADFAPHVRVNCIAPGRIENDWVRTLSVQSYQQAEQAIPLGRWGQPGDIVQAALFLTSSAASFITGQILVVNGGEIMR